MTQNSYGAQDSLDVGGKTNYHGVAKIKIARHTRLQVKVAKRGYDGFRQRLQFRNRPKVGVRVYRADLQWPRYGASPGRTGIRIRAKHFPLPR